MYNTNLEVEFNKNQEVQSNPVYMSIFTLYLNYAGLFRKHDFAV